MILIIGASGYIGFEFVKQLEEKHNIPYTTIPYKEASKEKLISLINKLNIQYIINATGYIGSKDTSSCEFEKYETIQGNILFPIMLKDICEMFGIVLCHISTGSLYTGLSPSFLGWTENDEPNFSFKFNNSNFYSGAKCMAEDYLKSYKKCYIWRLQFVFNHINSHKNHLSKLAQHNNIVLGERSLSNKEEFVNACIESIKRSIPFGIYNITNSNSISSKKIIEKLINTICPEKKTKFVTAEEFEKLNNGISISSCVLDNSKILSTGIKLSDVNESIDKCLKSWVW